MNENNIQVIRTKIDEGTSFITAIGKSSGRIEIETFVNKLVEDLKNASVRSEQKA